MIRSLRQPLHSATLRAALVAVVVRLAAAYQGRQPAVHWLGLLAAGGAGAFRAAGTVVTRARRSRLLVANTLAPWRHHAWSW